jgi:hypothetical protein
MRSTKSSRTAKPSFQISGSRRLTPTMASLSLGDAEPPAVRNRS